MVAVTERTEETLSIGHRRLRATGRRRHSAERDREERPLLWKHREHLQRAGAHKLIATTTIFIGLWGGGLYCA